MRISSKPWISACIQTYSLLFIIRFFFTSISTVNAFQLHPPLYSSLSSSRYNNNRYPSDYFIISTNDSCNSLIRRRRIFEIAMGKGDGKKKRPKKKKTVTTSASSPINNNLSNMNEVQSQPMRVTSDSNISVRQQIKWGKMKKEMMKSSSTSFRQVNAKKTSYRKSLDEKEIETLKEERRRRGQEVDWDVILGNSTHNAQPLIIIDAYNVIYKWSRLKKWMLKGNPRKARELLLFDLEELKTVKGWRIELVFDGANNNNPFSTTEDGTSRKSTPLGDGAGGFNIQNRMDPVSTESKIKVTDHGVRVVYSGTGTCADSYIESRCYEAKQKVTQGKITSSFIVVSDDHRIRIAAQNAGALTMSSQRIVDELKSVRKMTMHRVEVAVAKANANINSNSGSSGMPNTVRQPEKLRGKNLPTNTFFGRNQVLLVDKRKKKKKPNNEPSSENENEMNKEKDTEQQKKSSSSSAAELKDLKEGTKSIPSWAVVPNITKSSS